jgi:hypothetical protein
VYLGTIPLLISNYSDIFIEIISLLITEFFNGYRLYCYRGLFIIPLKCTVVVRALLVEEVVMGLYPDILKNILVKSNGQ